MSELGEPQPHPDEPQRYPDEPPPPRPSAAPAAAAVDDRARWWGLGDVWITLALYLFFAFLAAGVVLTMPDRPDPQAWAVVLSLVVPWIGLAGWPLLCTSMKGLGPVRELRLRGLEFEASLSRRQDDAHQEFLVLHNQAVAHAERITQDANEQVAASLDHAQRVSAKADDFEKLMRAQAQQIEADARVRAHEHLDRARDKAQHIIDTVTAHSQSVLRDAEDRTRQLRWQQHQLTSFMAEVKELIRPEMPLGESAGPDAAGSAVSGSDVSGSDVSDAGAVEVLEHAAEIVDAVDLDEPEQGESDQDASHDGESAEGSDESEHHEHSN